MAGQLGFDGACRRSSPSAPASRPSARRPATSRSRTAAAVLTAGPDVLRRPPVPESEPGRGLLHSPARDRAAVGYHYDTGNDFYRLLLGPEPGVLVRVLRHPDDTLDTAQERKLDYVCRSCASPPASASSTSAAAGARC